MLNISKGNDKETEEKAIGEFLAEKFISYK